MDDEIDDLLAKRETTHGYYKNTFSLAAGLSSVLTHFIVVKNEESDNIYPLSTNLYLVQPHHHVLTHILTKISRIVCCSYSDDHWDDIIGYAKLGKKLQQDNKNNN